MSMWSPWPACPVCPAGGQSLPSVGILTLPASHYKRNRGVGLRELRGTLICPRNLQWDSGWGGKLGQGCADVCSGLGDMHAVCRWGFSNVPFLDRRGYLDEKGA